MEFTWDRLIPVTIVKSVEQYVPDKEKKETLFKRGVCMQADLIGSLGRGRGMETEITQVMGNVISN
jgi:hypothetical protein